MIWVQLVLVLVLLVTKWQQGGWALFATGETRPIVGGRLQNHFTHCRHWNIILINDQKNNTVGVSSWLCLAKAHLESEHGSRLARVEQEEGRSVKLSQVIIISFTFLYFPLFFMSRGLYSRQNNNTFTLRCCLVMARLDGQTIRDAALPVSSWSGSLSPSSWSWWWSSSPGGMLLVSNHPQYHDHHHHHCDCLLLCHVFLTSALGQTFLLFLRSTDRLREDYDIAVAMIAPPQVGWAWWISSWDGVSPQEIVMILVIMVSLKTAAANNYLFAFPQSQEAARYGYELRLFDEAGFAYRGPLLSVTVESSKFWAQVSTTRQPPTCLEVLLFVIMRFVQNVLNSHFYPTGSSSPRPKLGRTWQLLWDNCEDF